MTVRLYTVYDRVTEEHSPLSEAVNDGSAHRSYAQAIKDVPNKDDYTLLYVGTYNKTTGAITPAKPHRVEPGQLELDISPEGKAANA